VRRWGATCGMLAAIALLPTTGRAQDAPAAPAGQTTPEGGVVLPPTTGGFAADDQVNEAAGDVALSMDKCSGLAVFEDDRIVRVQVSKGGALDDDVVNALLLKGAQYAWAQCPRPFLDLISHQAEGRFHYDVSEVDVYGPDNQLAYQATLGMYGMGDQGLIPGRTYRWKNFRNVLGERQKQAEADQAAATQAQAMAAQQAANATAAAASEAAGKRAAGQLWGFVQLLMLLGVGVWLWSQRLAILRFYYGLTPHPASPLVDGVIYSGESYDPDRLARILAVTPENSVEREVRARQARDLLRNLSAHSERTKAELEEETEYLKGQAGLAEGLEMQARIKRRLETILRAQGKLA